MRGPPLVHTARTVRCAATPPRQPPLGFAAPNAAAVRVAILGDLHLDSRHTPSFDAAAADIRRLLEQGAADGLEPRLIQLGDLGASAEAPGTSRLFESARGFLASALPPGAPPPALVVGNHDLEGVTEFDGLFPHDDTGKEADAANLAAWSSVFNQAPTWAAPLGPALAIGLSTTTWRSNRDSVHEVAIPVEEIQWFEDTIADAARSSTPVLVFTHAPPAGCGLRVVQSVHVRNRCAFLNHSDRATAARFVAAVERHPGAVAVWASGHYHLSSNYASSTTRVADTVFAQVGVIGPGSTRDGVRQSRLVDVDERGWTLSSVDHGAGGSVRVDASGEWKKRAPHILPVPHHQLLDPAADTTWLASALDCSVGGDDSGSESDGEWPAPQGRAPQPVWLDGGFDALLAFTPSDGAVVEYSASLRCPVGYVFDGLPAGATVRRVRSYGSVLADADDGRDAAAVEAVAGDGAIIERRQRNYEGGWSHVYQGNKWRKKRAEARAVQAV